MVGPAQQPDFVAHLSGSKSACVRCLWVQAHEETGRLVVVQVTLTFCGPCAKVYPTVLQMSQRMADVVVFGRLFGDRNEGTKALLTELGIVEAPTFLFYRNKKLLGRYVGSGKGELIGEVLRHQGVDCT